MGEPAVFEPGDQVEVVVTQVTKDWTFVDFGGKADGYIRTNEFLDPEGGITVQQGDTVSAFYLPSLEHTMRFTTRLTMETVDADSATNYLEDAFRSGIPLDGVVEKEIKGGFAVKIGGNVRVFCPYSQIAIHKVEDAAQWLGRHLTFKVIEYEKKGRNVVVSHRAILEEEREETKKALRKTLREGMTVRGTITSVASFGAFVDIGGLEGLIPISEASWGHVKDIHALVREGQEVEVVAKSLDWDRDKFSFSLKAAQSDPWEAVSAKYPEGSTHAGTVARLTPFGVFVTLEPGVDGLLHISQLGKEKHVRHPKEVLEENQAIEVKIGRVDVEQRRLSLEMPTNDVRSDAEYEKYRAGNHDSSALGSLGDLLRAKMNEKKDM
jgi:small subunit ribosomal protein S1